MNPVMCYFSNFGFCGWAQGIPAMISIPGNPFNSYGAVVAFGNEQNVSVRYGLYQIAPSTFAPDLHGLDFSFNKGIGIAQFVEARIPVKISSLLPVKLNPKTNTVSLAAPEDASMLYQSLLPQGTITLGGWLGSGAYQTVSNPEETQPQNNGAYGIASFKIPSLDVGLDHRIFISGGVGFTPDVQQFRSGGNAGVVIAGLIPKRPFDTLSFGASYANYNSNYYLAGAESNTYSPNTEFGLELNYSMNLSQSLRIMPNLQIIINPAGNSAQSTVLVGGVQAWLFF
jgi:carbohydrate-selective porin OprB